MILTKTMPGVVVQKFDSETGRCISQEFVAGNPVEFMDPKGDRIEDGMYGLEPEGFYFPPPTATRRRRYKSRGSRSTSA
jgi:hypothetical protein